MKFDAVLEKIGEFGTYQKRVFFLLGFPIVSIGSFMLMSIVVTYTPDHRCKLPGLENDTYAIHNSDHQLLLNKYVPVATDPTLKYDRCNLYDIKHVVFDDDNRPVNASRVKCHEWVYDTSVFYDTFTTKANLVCDDALKTSHVQMLFFFGVFVGDVIFGYSADIIGRKIALYTALMVMLATAVGVTWVQGFYLFAFLQFIIGASSHGAYLVIAVIAIEMVGPSKRVWTGILIEVIFAVGVCYLSLMAFLFRSWPWINLSVAIPCAVYPVYWWLIPESPRWLMSQGKHRQSVDIIKRAARVNKITVPEHLMQLDTDTGSSKGRIWHIVARPLLLRRILILFFNWMVVSMTYYGVTMNAGNMAGNFYLNFFLMGAAEFPGLVIAIALLDRIGRRWTTAGSMFIGGVACLATVPTVLWSNADLQPLAILLAVIGKAGAASAFAILYVFTAELLPTVVRNAALGSCSCAARIGGMLAPYIAKSGELIGGKFGQVEPLIIFGALTIAAGVLLLLLPETLDQKLPDTIKEGEEFGRKQETVTGNEIETGNVD